MSSTRLVDPLVGFQFALTVDDVTGYFTEVSGIGSENAVVTHKDSGKTLALFRCTQMVLYAK